MMGSTSTPAEEGVMALISRGFRGRRRADVDPARIPPGQYVVDGFPVLSAGPTPRVPLDQWTFTIRRGGADQRTWSWDEFLALPAETIHTDIHCVTKWTKLDTDWKGVSLDVLLDGVGTSARFLLAFCDGGYTTNLPLAELTGGRSRGAYRYHGRPLEPEHGGPPPLLGP